MAPERLSSKGQAWFCTTGLPSDVVVEVGQMSFHLHKFPLMSKSRKLHKLIAQQEQNTRARSDVTLPKVAAEAKRENDQQEERRGEEEEEIIEDDTHHISLPNFPGGSENFESAAKFCYGVKIELNSWNVAPLRCAAEYLEMTDEFAEDNLISRSERFLAQSVLKNLKESVNALKSCEDLLPLAEDLDIPQRCIDSIAARACSSDPSSVFGWPVNEAIGGDHRSPNPILWNGIDTGIRRNKSGIRSSAVAAADSWFEDLTILSLPLYKRVISEMKARDLVSSDAIEQSLISYAKRSIPGLSRSIKKRASSAPQSTESEQRELLETVITNMPLEKRAGARTAAVTSTRFLFGLLKTVNILRASEASRTVLERKIAWQVEEATLDDLLMPSYSYLVETLYDVDCIERIFKHFLERLLEEEKEGKDGVRSPSPGRRRVMKVGKLLDGYLAEVASDANLQPDRFCELAAALPDDARLFDDGLYRAVDMYLKAHLKITEVERERVCSVMDCQKLTPEACAHAAQNERLPLRSVVQVLFFEQLQLRHAIAGTLGLAADQEVRVPQPRKATRAAPGRGAGAHQHSSMIREGDTWGVAARENQVLRLDMDSMRSRVQELEHECLSMKSRIHKMDRGMVGVSGVLGAGSAWISFTKRFGCKFKTQVSDSQGARTFVASKKSTEEQSI